MRHGHWLKPTLRTSCVAERLRDVKRGGITALLLLRTHRGERDYAAALVPLPARCARAIARKGKLARRSGSSAYRVKQVRAFRQVAAPVPDREIVAHGFFAPDALPNETTASTRARIFEVLNGAPVSERW